MNEINWHIFRAKFNGKEQETFENLAYLLFCREHNLPSTGIFGYKNQTGIEKEPIQVNGEWIGFQAKFFETKINQQQIKESVKKAKNRNPELDKIYLYTNQKFSEGKNQKEPQSKKEIEEFAESNGVKIVWRVKSNIEAQLFLDDKNKNLAQYFFSSEKSIIDFITELNSHSSSLLERIGTQINFNETEIKIDRSNTLASLKTSLENSLLLILSGEGGVGKTALIKDFYYSVKDEVPFFIFKATEFNLAHINNLFNKYGKFTLTDFVQEYAEVNEKYIVIDSAEKLSDLDYQETFQEFLSTLIRNHWKIIFTTRHSYLSDLKNQFVGIYRQRFELFNIPKLKVDELKELSKNYNFILPKDERFLELLRIPFYLNEFLQNYKNIGENINYSDFKNLLWNKQILNSSHRKNNVHLKREKCFLNIAKKRANTGRFFVNVDECENLALQGLEEDDIINYDFGNDGYFITHDIYEEWALDKIIESSFRNSENWNVFFESLGSSLPIRRAFRNWLSDKLLNNREGIKLLVENSFISEEIESFWKDEILVSVLLSDYSEVFFKMFEKVLLADNQNLLMRTIFLLRIACKEIDESLLTSLGLDENDKSNFRSAYTKPKGNGWISTIEFIHKHIEKIDVSKLDQIIPLLDEWNKKNKRGIATQRASQIALYYLEEINKEGLKYRLRDSKEKIIEIILNGAIEVKEELENIFNEILAKKDKDDSNTYYDLIQTVLSSALTSFQIAIILPEQTIKLADLFWYESKEEKLEKVKERRELGYSSYDRQEIEDYFCISQGHRQYYPSSAYQTPIFQLALPIKSDLPIISEFCL